MRLEKLSVKSFIMDQGGQEKPPMLNIFFPEYRKKENRISSQWQPNKTELSSLILCP